MAEPFDELELNIEMLVMLTRRLYIERQKRGMF